MYAACRRRAVWLHRAAWIAVSTFGPAALPGRRHAWESPIDPPHWDALAGRWRQALGPFDTAAVYQRKQAGRQAFMLLLIRAGKPIAFIKLRQGDGSPLRVEASALGAVVRFEPGSFSVCKPLSQGHVSDWHYLATAALPPRPHRCPASPPFSLILQEIEAALADLPRPETRPGHWRPTHGDLTPWNLRRLADRSLILFDWEAAGWGPPGADEVLHRATAAALGVGPAAPSDAREAIDFWQDRIHDRPAEGGRNRELAEALDQVLERMRAAKPQTTETGS